MQQTNDFDKIAFLVVEKIEDPSDYYDVNRIHKLKDKLSPEVGQILMKYISGLKKLCQELNPHEFLKQSNMMLLELAKNPQASRKEYSECLKQLKDFSYLP